MEATIVQDVPEGSATSAFRKPVPAASANMAPRLKNSGDSQHRRAEPKMVPAAVESSVRTRSGLKGSLRFGSNDSDPCSTMWRSVMPFMTAASCDEATIWTLLRR